MFCVHAGQTSGVASAMRKYISPEIKLVEEECNRSEHVYNTQRHLFTHTSTLSTLYNDCEYTHSREIAVPKTI